MGRRIRGLGVAILISAAALQVVHAARETSYTFDEPIYVGAGAYILGTGNFDVDALWYNGPLSYYVNGLLFPFLDLGDEFYAVPDRGPVQFGKGVGARLLTRSDFPEDQALRFARYPFALVLAGLCLGILLWTRRLYGEAAAWVALALVAFCPTLLAHSAVATMDLTLTVTFFFAVVAFWRWNQRPSGLRAALVGFCAALALLSKATGIILLPLFLFFALRLGRTSRRDLKQALIALAVALLTVFVAYGFRFGTLASVADRPHTFLDAVTQTSPSLHSLLYVLAERFPVPAPEFWKMLFITPFRLHDPRVVYFLGEAAPKHHFLYFPVAVLLKSTLPSLLLFAAAGLQRILRPSARQEADRWVLLPLAFVLLVGMTQQHTIGVRYVLPLFPFLVIFAAAAVSHLPLRRPLILAGLGALLVWNAVTTVRIAPNYLSYFNEAVGGPERGHEYLVDSDLDWGQNIRGLRDWMRARGVGEFTLAHQTMVEPTHYGFEYKPIACTPSKGYVAVSVTVLMSSIRFRGDGAEPCLRWLEDHDPIDRIGYSIWIYRIL
jgi:4-amino-4-deoxy-L-arabinose transferase-like glycosyltransferase